MAQAKIVKSKRGNDLVVVTMGPKELAKVVAIIEQFGAVDQNVESVYNALVAARPLTRNAKYAEAYEQSEAVVKLI